MDRKRLISVVVPIFNVENYIRKCIESICNQTYSNLQIVLVDDGSTDSSGAICDDYALIDSRITVIHKKNGGLSDARNAGIDIAFGEFIAFVDGDDWIHPQMYELMLEQIVEKKADFVTCGFQQHDEQSFIKKIEKKSINYIELTGTEAMAEIEKPFVMAWNKLYRKELFDDIRYPVGRLHEDEFVIHRLLYKACKIVVLEKPLYFYTIREGSIVDSINVKRIDDAIAAFRDRVEFAVEVGWLDAIPIAVARFCDYCVSKYYDIKNGTFSVDAAIMDKLWNAERAMVEKFNNIRIERKYVLFSKSPGVYERYLERKERLIDVRNFIFFPLRIMKKVIKNVIKRK